jgi:hypothetical protein
MVDAARGDSVVVRRMEADVREWLRRPTAEREAAIRRVLERWRDNHARLAPFAGGSVLLREYMPVSEDLAALGRMGLAALDGRVEAGWVAVVAAMGKPRLEVVLGAARPVGLLVSGR